MGISTTLDEQISRAVFGLAVIGLVAMVIQFFLPLDAPGGHEATVAERVAWLADDPRPFILGWINQIVAMISLSGIFAGLAWRIAGTHPLRSIVAATFVALATMAFFINKFMAVWTIPLLADAIATGSAASEMAEILFPILNVSVPFSLFTSLDYLGFWLYSLFALLVARPLLGGTAAAKVSGAMLGVFGLLYQGIVVAVLGGAITGTSIELYVLSLFIPLIAVMVAALPLFRTSSTTESAPS